jgi:hypothetical protein
MNLASDLIRPRDSSYTLTGIDMLGEAMIRLVPVRLGRIPNINGKKANERCGY